MNFLKSSLAIAAICIAQISYAQDFTPISHIEAGGPAGYTDQQNGHSFYHQYMYEKVIVQDPETGIEETKLVRSEKIDLLDGDKIYYENEATEPVGAAAQSTLDAFLKSYLAEEIKTFKKDYGHFSCFMIIDAKGKLAYLTSNTYTEKSFEVKEVHARFVDIEKKLQALTFIPAKKDGKAVPYGFSISDF